VQSSLSFLSDSASFQRLNLHSATHFFRLRYRTFVTTHQGSLRNKVWTGEFSTMHWRVPATLGKGADPKVEPAPPGFEGLTAPTRTRVAGVARDGEKA
jgi:hypothetical protein